MVPTGLRILLLSRTKSNSEDICCRIKIMSKHGYTGDILPGQASYKSYGGGLTRFSVLGWITVCGISCHASYGTSDLAKCWTNRFCKMEQ